MKRQMFAKLFSFIVMLTCLVSPTQAALITTNFSDLNGNQGTVDIQLSLNSGETLQGFQVFFSETLFADLAILNSPTSWDSLILTGIQSPILFDSFNLFGLDAGKATLSFTFSGQGALPELYYEFYDENFAVTGSGTAKNIQTTVPESSGAVLLILGFLGLGLQRRLASRKLRAQGVSV